MLLIITSCGSNKSIQQVDVQAEANPKLIFLNYTISKTGDGFKQVQFINKRITEGRLKKATTNYLNSGKIGDLKCAQLDKQSNEIPH